MKNKRITFLIVSLLTICTGLFVRLKKQWFPDSVNLYLGDILYAFMMFYIVSFFTVNKSRNTRAVIALAICYCIELLQLYQAGWINTLRQTLPGKLVLGSGFLWSDLLAYSIGVAMAFIFEKIMLFKGK
ncbi:ribosomal maturation YjgA family protein [Flavobacterium hauense]